ncbi:MAG TPA: sigma-70 family RNA polymerase sigma factor, partial [Gemmataceae bacterium]|nr:sigma-70 family RNA polymerase sigma factor [Gemmataceae bacterium]
RQVRLQEQDAADLVQDVFAVLLHKLPEFKYDPTKSFRAWLRTVMLNKWRDSRKRRTVPCVELHDGGLSQIAGPDGARGLEESEFRQYLVRRTLRLIQPEFQAGTWKAFQEYLVAGRPATEVARRAGISLNALYLAKSHVLRRLREELDGLLD